MSSIVYAQLNEQQKKDILFKMYLEQRLSLAEIAKQLNTYSNKLRRDAIKFDIKLRDKSKAQKNALKSGRHKHPTKGTERDEETKSKIGMGVLKTWENLSDAEKTARQEAARKNWENLSEDEKMQILKAANNAVRETSKIGSKLERYLHQQLLADGYKVDFHKEQMLSNTKLQIDLFLPSMNVAIEIDGPSHFKEVWGKDVLNKNIKYDNKKTGLILGKGLVLIRIKQEMDFSNSRAKLIYDKLLIHIKDIDQKFPSSGNREIKIGDNQL
jgi:hypothetical protein